MKVILTENQMVRAYQTIVDMALDNVKEYCQRLADSDFYLDSETDCDNVFVVEDINVATAYANEIGLVFYVNTNYYFDMGGPFYEIEQEIREITGSKNIKVKLLNVINKKERGNWS